MYLTRNLLAAVLLAGLISPALQTKSFAEDTAKETTEQKSKPAPQHSINQGIASHYGGKFHGRKTASGERYNQNELTAAHRKAPFGSKFKVTRLRPH